jgi:hypothetical protein
VVEVAVRKVEGCEGGEVGGVPCWAEREAAKAMSSLSCLPHHLPEELLASLGANRSVPLCTVDQLRALARGRRTLEAEGCLEEACTTYTATVSSNQVAAGGLAPALLRRPGPGAPALAPGLWAEYEQYVRTVLPGREVLGPPAGGRDPGAGGCLAATVGGVLLYTLDEGW